MKVYAKTGTSSESNDLWMVAGTPYYVASVWYGFDKPQQIYNQAAAATVWKTIMTEVHKGLEKKEFTQPKDLTEVKYCKSSGLLAGKKCYSTEKGYLVPDVQIETCSGKHTSVPSSSSSAPSSSSTPPVSSTPAPSTPPSTPSSSESTSSTSSEASKPTQSESSKPETEESKPAESGAED